MNKPYDTTEILRQNVADLELELQRQRERADKAESAMASAREDLQSFIDSRDAWMVRAEKAEAELAKLAQQEPVAWKHENGNVFLPWQKDLIVTGAKFSPLYTRPIPAPAPAPAPAVPGPYLLGGRRFKISINGEGGFYGFEGFPELNGQWVALVDATDNRHMQSA